MCKYCGDNTCCGDCWSALLACLRRLCCCYGGDAAVKEYELLFDKVRLDSLAVNEDEMMEADCLVDDSLKSAIELAHENIAKFHSAQKFQTK